jgi:hypothetical protein
LVNASLCSVTAVDVPTESIAFQVFPNPSSGRMILEWAHEMDEGMLQVFDLLGHKVFEDVLHHIGQYDLILDQPAGIYMLQVQEAQGSYMRKIVVQD